MKYSIFLMLWLILTAMGYSCKARREQEPAGKKDTAYSSEPATQAYVYWTTDPDTGRYIQLHPAESIFPDSLNTGHMIRYMNLLYPEIAIREIGLQHDTLHLALQNSHYLTQQMGSHGARVYLAELTYNCTEVPGIHFVHLDFEEGDHASPGTYARSQFMQP